MKSQDAAARRKAARDLASSGAAGVPALIRGISDRDRSVREAAVASLGAIGPAARAAVPYLQQALNAPKTDSVIMTAEEMKEMTREEDFRRAIKDALQKIQR